MLFKRMSVLFWLLIQTLNSFDSYVGWSIAEFKKKYRLTHNYVSIFFSIYIFKVFCRSVHILRIIKHLRDFFCAIKNLISISV